MGNSYYEALMKNKELGIQRLGRDAYYRELERAELSSRDILGGTSVKAFNKLNRNYDTFVKKYGSDFINSQYRTLYEKANIEIDNSYNIYGKIKDDFQAAQFNTQFEYADTDEDRVRQATGLVPSGFDINKTLKDYIPEGYEVSDNLTPEQLGQLMNDLQNQEAPTMSLDAYSKGNVSQKAVQTQKAIEGVKDYYADQRAALDEENQNAAPSNVPENMYDLIQFQQQAYEGWQPDDEHIKQGVFDYNKQMAEIDEAEKRDIKDTPYYVEDELTKQRLEDIQDPEFETKASQYVIDSYGKPLVDMTPADWAEGYGADTILTTKDIMYLPAMTDKQRQVYAYHMVTNEDNAKQYLDSIKREVNANRAEMTQEGYNYVADQPGGKVLLAAGSIPAKLGSGLSHLGTGISALGEYEPADPNALYMMPAQATSQMRQSVTKDMGETGKFLTNTGLSIADFAVAYLATGGAGGIATAGGKAATTGLMASEAAGMTAYDVMQRGGTKGEAWLTGAVVGGVEAATEMISIGALDDAIKSIRALKNATDTTKRQIAAQYVKNTLIQAGTEGGEEMISEVAGNIVDIAINGDNSSYEIYVKELMAQDVPEVEARQQAGFKFFGKDVALAGLGGALSGGAMGGGVQVGQLITSQSDVQAAEALIKDLDTKIAETTNENLKKELTEVKETVQSALDTAQESDTATLPKQEVQTQADIIEHAKKYIEVNEGSVPATRTGRDSEGSYVTADDVKPNFVYVTKENVDQGTNVSSIDGTAIKHYTINGTDQGDTIVFSEAELDADTINKYSLTPLDIKPVNTQGAAEQLNEKVLNNNFKDTKFRDTVKDALNIKTPLDEQFKQNLSDMVSQYETTDNVTQKRVAKEFVDNNFEQAEKYIKESERFQSSADAAIVSEIVKRYRETGRADEALEMIRQTAIKFSKAGQAVQSAAIWKLNTPEGMVKAVERAIEKANEKTRKKYALSEQEAKVLMDSVDNMQTMSAKDIGSMFFDILKRRKIKVTKAIESEINKLVDNNETDTLKDATYQNLTLEVLDKVPRGIGQKISTIQAFSHLINPRTALRNVSANTVFRFQELFADYGAAFFDYLMSLKSGQRTVAVPSLRPSSIGQNLKNSQELARESVFEVQTGVRLRNEQGKYELFKGETFTPAQNKVLNKIERLLGYELKTPDQFAKGGVEISELRKQLALQGKDVQGKTIDELYEMADDETIQIAKQQALYNTFQDDGLLAGLFAETKKVLNKVGIKEQFGLGDLIIKYTRVPGNLIQRSLDYSPVGALKTLKFLGKKNLTRMQQREIAKTLSRSITGSTTFAAIGYLLTSLGLMVSPGGDDREKNLLQDLGVKGRKINITAISRILKGESAELQEGDKLVSFDFLETINVPLSLGHELAKAIDNDLSTDEIVSNLGDTFKEEILDMPTMYIINSMVYESLDPNGQPMLVPLKQAVPGFIPAPLRQAAVASDPYQRERDDFIDNLQYNTPLREDLLPQIDAFGQPVEKDTGVWTFFDPGNTSTYNAPEFTDDLLRLSEIDPDVIPTGKTVKDFTINGEKYVLDEAEQNEFMQEYGTRLAKVYAEIIGSGKTNDEKVQALLDAQASVKNDVKREYALEANPPNIPDELVDLYKETDNPLFLLDEETFKYKGQEFKYPVGWEEEVIDELERTLENPDFDFLSPDEQADEIEEDILAAKKKIEDEVTSQTPYDYLVKTQKGTTGFDIKEVAGWGEFDIESDVISALDELDITPKNPQSINGIDVTDAQRKELAEFTYDLLDDLDSYTKYTVTDTVDTAYDVWKAYQISGWNTYDFDDTVIEKLTKLGVKPINAQSYKGHEWTDTEKQKIAQSTYTMLRSGNWTTAEEAKEIMEQAYKTYKANYGH